MYKLSKDLIDGLKSKSINYCHWKSNLLLNEALNGYDDLDLLVKKEDIHRFEILLHKLGFKRASIIFMVMMKEQVKYFIFTFIMR